MTSHTSNTASIQQAFMNNITQTNQENCLATTTNSANNNVVIVNGANIKGNFTGVSATTSTDASCLMVSNMQNSISNILSATIQQTNTSETDWFNGFQFTKDKNTFNLTQTVVNNISQITQSTCSSNTTASTNNNYVYVASGTTIGGDFVGVTNAASSSANCSINNIMKNTTYNQAQANVDQSNTVKGMFVAIAGSILMVVGLIVITVIILVALGVLGSAGVVGYSFFGGSKPKPAENATTSLPPTTSLPQNTQYSPYPAYPYPPEYGM